MPSPMREATVTAGGDGISRRPRHHFLRAMGEEKHNRRLQDDPPNVACNCECPTTSGTTATQPVETIRMVVSGDPSLETVSNRFINRADAWTAKTGVKIEFDKVGGWDELHDEVVSDATSGAGVFDGYLFSPSYAGDMVLAGGLADLTEFVRTNEAVNWTDIFIFTRDTVAVYDSTVHMIPCDGDIFSMYYRKDLFEKYNVEVPRTWDEYTEAAKFFHGMEVKRGTTNETTTLNGSCIARAVPACGDLSFFATMVHSTLTQTKGTTHGHFFDSTTMDPLTGEAMAETLRHMENQVKYGHPEAYEKCGFLNVGGITNGTCAMTFFWGDVFARHLAEGNVIDGLLGVAPVPGSPKVLDRETGKLVKCTSELCPYATNYEDIGLVNKAPYAAGGGGWTVAVSSGSSKARQDAMADFFGHVCGTQEALADVIPDAKGTVFTGADPYRKTQLDVNSWVQKGYPKETTELYLQTVFESLDFPNTVLDLRIPEAGNFMSEFKVQAFNHLNKSTSVNQTFEDRMTVSNSIEQAWKDIIIDFDKREDTIEPLKTVYQKSLNVYNQPSGDSSNGGTIAGIIIACVAIFAVVVGLVAWYFLRREKKKKKRYGWLIKTTDIKLTDEVLGKGSFGAVFKANFHQTPVAVKTSRHKLSKPSSDKTLKSSNSTDASVGSFGNRLSMAQLKEDIAALVKVRHPNVVQTFGAAINKQCVMVVLEYMPKGSLAGILANPKGIGGITTTLNNQWALQIARGLDSLHSLAPPLGPLLHRDLKSSNVLIDSSFNAKIANFNLQCRVLGSPRDEGSLLWKAPEELNGAVTSKESDVYSYGMLLFEILAKARPFLVQRCISIGTDSTRCVTMSTEPFRPSSRKDSETSAAETVSSELTDVYGDETCTDYYGEHNGKKMSVPEIVSLVSDLTREPPMRPKLPPKAPQVLKDLCVECWNKNPNRRPSTQEIIKRLKKNESGDRSLTERLVTRSNVFDSILPQHVQELISRGETVPPEKYEEVTVIFSDVVGFTNTSSKLSAEEVGDLIRRLFTKFDDLAEEYGVKKLDVIGDAFLGVTGIPEAGHTHAVHAAAFALQAIEAALKIPVCPTKPELGVVHVRFGLATGPVVATVIGSAQHPKYTLFGTTVNTSSRMESSSKPDRVQCTTETANLIKKHAPEIVVDYREKMEIKGRGCMDTYFVNPPKDGYEVLSKFAGKELDRTESTKRMSMMNDIMLSEDSKAFMKNMSSLSALEA